MTSFFDKTKVSAAPRLCMNSCSVDPTQAQHFLALVYTHLVARPIGPLTTEDFLPAVERLQCYKSSVRASRLPQRQPPATSLSSGKAKTGSSATADRPQLAPHRPSSPAASASTGGAYRPHPGGRARTSATRAADSAPGPKSGAASPPGLEVQVIGLHQRAAIPTGSATGGDKVTTGEHTCGDKGKGWLAYECPKPDCNRKGQRFTRTKSRSSAGAQDQVQAKPFPECLAEGHYNGRLAVYTNGQFTYPVIAGPRKDKFDEEEYPVMTS